LFCKDARTARVAAAKFERAEALQYVAACFRASRAHLSEVLALRSSDRVFTDAAVRAANAPGLGALPGPLGQQSAFSKPGHVPFGPHNSGEHFFVWLSFVFF
jgi:hypothetical protein